MEHVKQACTQPNVQRRVSQLIAKHDFAFGLASLAPLRFNLRVTRKTQTNVGYREMKGLGHRAHYIGMRNHMCVPNQYPDTLGSSMYIVLKLYGDISLDFRPAAVLLFSECIIETVAHPQTGGKGNIHSKTQTEVLHTRDSEANSRFNVFILGGKRPPASTLNLIKTRGGPVPGLTASVTPFVASLPT